MGDRMAAMRAIGVADHGHFLAVARGPGNRFVDRAGQGPRRAARHREISALDIMFGKQVGEADMGSLGLGSNHDTGSKLVEAVDNAGPLHAADAGQLSLAMMEQGVDQRAIPAAGRRMDGHAGRLVDDDEVFVLEQDIERDVFRLRHGGHRGGQRQSVDAADNDRLAGIVCCRAVDGHGALLDQGLGA